jgi:dTDP-4-dehydrorhamnose 3,5-epimerase
MHKICQICSYNVEFKSIHIKGPKLITPKVFGDHRGYFFESFNESHFQEAGIVEHFKQDNQSLSNKGILRGLHFQAPPYDQGKLVRVIKGAVLDVIVDIRSTSPTYGQHYLVELTEENFLMLWIPPGFAHGFYTLKDGTIFSYKCTEVYAPQSEGGLMWNDPNFKIDWGVTEPILSDKDKHYKAFDEFLSPFVDF